MPRDGFRWCHITLHARNSWLHGDPRGFRDRNHRKHSSGDYRNPPPAGEHDALHRYFRRRAGAKRRFDSELRLTVCGVAAAKLEAMDCNPLVVAVPVNHLHLLALFPSSHDETDKLIARLKQRTSHAVGTALPKPLWAQGCDVEPIKSEAHQRAAFAYIRDKQGMDAAVWTFRLPGASLRSALGFRNGVEYIRDDEAEG
ncbi:MAG: hypothetical protein AAF656_10025 [Planctomycetota bacterium]